MPDAVAATAYMAPDKLVGFSSRRGPSFRCSPALALYFHTRKRVSILSPAPTSVVQSRKVFDGPSSRPISMPVSLNLLASHFGVEARLSYKM